VYEANPDERHTVIKTQTVQENNKPIAAIMDFKEYARLSS